MLKTTVNNGPEKLWFQEEVSEARAVDGHIGTLNLFLSCWCATLRESLGLLILLIVQKLIINIILCHLGETKKTEKFTYFWLRKCTYLYSSKTNQSKFCNGPF